MPLTKLICLAMPAVGLNSTLTSSEKVMFLRYYTGHGSSVGSVRFGEREVTGSIPGRNVPKSLKLY